MLQRTVAGTRRASRWRARCPLQPALIRKPGSSGTTAHTRTVQIEVADIEINEYLSGHASATLLGRIVDSIFPPPIRFLACWISPLAALIALHPHQVVMAMAYCFSAVQGYCSFVPHVAAFVSKVPHLQAVGWTVLTLLPTFFTFLLLPLLDFVLGEEEAPGMRPDKSAWYLPLYRIVLHGFVLIYLAALASAVHVVATNSLPWYILAAIVLNGATVGGFAFTVAHELVHSRHAVDRMFGDVLLATLGYLHWAQSHMAHHLQVATEVDPATARFREPVYAFFVRSVVGNWKDAVRMELQRVKKSHAQAGVFEQLLRSRIPGWLLWPAFLLGGTQVLFGTASTAVFASMSLGGIFLLEVVNYIEHYGLARRRLPNGRFEPVSEHHSWNANHMLTNAVTLRLQRHTDHHMHAQRPYYELENVAGSPRLPASYSAMVLLALVPPAWFCVMNPRVHIYKLLSEVSNPQELGPQVAPA